ncbi:MotA/TolQ/ExbB proton channel family protein [candidate division KSB1 bacterium]|nr:MotA/TolQ/ExbB proton channel family protein [candidate division KSB1 bacterium]
MRIVQKGQTHSIFIGLLLTFLMSIVGLCSAAEYQVQILDIQRTVHKNWLGVPTSFDANLQWDVFQTEATQLVPADLSKFSEFQVVCINQSTEPAHTENLQVQSNTATFINKKAGVPYAFLVLAMDGDGTVAVSDTAWVQTGRMRADTEIEDQQPWTNYIPFNGRIPMALMGKGLVYDGATRAGKIAFHMIWNFLIIGMIVWVFFCWQYLSLRHVFPLYSRFQFGRSFDNIYQNCISKEFENIILQWREITESANDHVRAQLSKGTQNCVDDISMENATFWREKGTEGIRQLMTRMKKFYKFPTARIVEAGLENHELGGFRWLEVSKEVDRAIENQASSEMEKLRRQSLMDWLWNLGTLSPLVGLFGTATGISQAFAQLTSLRSDITQTALVKSLAGGIFEALWTTILGLFVGIFLMLLYFYYQNKLHWIYAKWEEIYVHVTRKL